MNEAWNGLCQFWDDLFYDGEGEEDGLDEDWEVEYDDETGE